MILDNACFHCQQSIEKNLKAFLCYNGENIERTHDIDFLLQKCANFDSIFSTVDSLNINDYAVLGRYPDANLLPDIDEAKAFYQLAIEVGNLVKERIIFTE